MSESTVPAPAAPRRRRRRRRLIEGAVPIKPSTGFERARRGIHGGSFSATVSLASHVLLILLLAWWIVDREKTRLPPKLDMRWLTAEEIDENLAARSPVRISSIPDGTPTVPSVPEPPPATPQPLKPTRPAVRPVAVAGMLGSRTPKKRKQRLAPVDAGGKSDLAVRSALGWLSRQQMAGGNWRLHEGYPQAGRRTARTDTGATSLALLAFLGAGFDHVKGEHKDCVARGLGWLAGQQRDDGNLFDIDEFGREETYYAHSMATIALCEAVAMTADRRARQAAQKAVEFLVASQQPEQGGWKYQPQTPLTTGDLSVTGWALMALHSARIAGLTVPEDAFLKASSFLDTVEAAKGARYRYEPQFPVSQAMTAEGLLCRQWLGWPRDHPGLEDGVRYLLGPKFRPHWNDGRRNVYAWYYTAQVLHNMGGPEWEEWYGQVRQEIVSNQLRTGTIRKGLDVRGSWHPHQPKGQAAEKSEIAGRLYLVAMCVLILETPYRHEGVYQESGQ